MFDCTVLEHHRLTESIVKTKFEAPEITEKARPGQFVHVRIRSGIDPLLRRPFSIHRVDRDKGELELLYRVIGQGTQLMHSLSAGDRVNMMGPLGNGFDLGQTFDRAVIVAGGMGGAPVFFLIDELLRMKKKVTLLWGVRDGREIFNEENFKNSSVDLRIATEDASKGHCGLVTDLLDIFLKESKQESLSWTGFVCGPECMIQAVRDRILSRNEKWQVSMEERMACAVGVCLGCAVSVQDRGYQMVCKDGPVFDLKEILFND
jgi:dihydroorotate dehydrogenase electron transfer subunit